MLFADSASPHPCADHQLSSGNGYIYKAKVLKGGDIVVVKLTPQGGMGGMSAGKAAREWMEPIFAMQHPNVLRMYAHQEYPHGSAPAGLMECIMMHFAGKGVDLIDCIMGNMLGAEGYPTKVDAIKQMAAGVAHCHERVGPSRDLKPDNFLVDLEGAKTSGSSPKVLMMDFGHVKAKDSISDTAKRGTTAYQPPEVAYMVGSGKYDGVAMDMWGLGVSYYAMLCTAFPWGGTTTPVPRDMTGSFPSGAKANKKAKFDALPADAQAMIAGLMTAEPKERWTMERLMGCDYFQGGSPLDETFGGDPAWMTGESGRSITGQGGGAAAERVESDADADELAALLGAIGIGELRSELEASGVPTKDVKLTREYMERADDLGDFPDVLGMTEAHVAKVLAWQDDA